MKKADYSQYYTDMPIVKQAVQSLEAGANAVPWRYKFSGRGSEFQARYNQMLPDVINAALQRQKEQDDLQRMQEIKNYADSLLQEGKKETVGQVNPNFPSLNPEYIPPMDGQPMPQRRNVGLSMQEAEAILKAAFGGSNASYGLNQLSQVESNKYGEASGEKQSPLLGAVSQNQSQPIYFPYADQMITSGASVINNARQYGESNKQFTQEFPGQNALRQAQARKANAEAKYNEAGLPYVGQESNAKVNQINAGIANTQAGTKKIITEVEQLALKPYDDYTAASNIVKANTDALKKLGLISDTGVFDQNKLQSLDAGQQGKAIELQRQLQIARSNQIAAGERIKKIEGVNSQGKQTPGSKTLEMTAPQGQRGLKLPSGKML